jgi:hypothetical protein
MPLIRKAAVQGHAVPHGYQAPRGPFPPEIFARNPRAYDSFDHPEALPEELDDVRMFRCKDCKDILYEDELDIHECEEE